MQRAILAGVIALVMLVPQAVQAADDESFIADRREEIYSLTSQIMGTSFEPVKITVQGETRKEAFVQAAELTREHLKKYQISPLMDHCLYAVPFLTNAEYAMIKLWREALIDEEVVQNGVRITIRLSPQHLMQMALYNLWPLQYSSFHG
mgnify:CR=1 FL=1